MLEQLSSAELRRLIDPTHVIVTDGSREAEASVLADRVRAQRVLSEREASCSTR